MSLSAKLTALTIAIAGIAPQMAFCHSVKESTALSAFLAALADATQESPSLIHFSYSENENPGEKANCARVQPHEPSRFLLNVAQGLLPGQKCNELCQKGLAEFETLIGNAAYTQCREGETAKNTYTEHTHFIAEDGTYRISFELGYSD